MLHIKWPLCIISIKTPQHRRFSQIVKFLIFSRYIFWATFVLEFVIWGLPLTRRGLSLISGLGYLRARLKPEESICQLLSLKICDFWRKYLSVKIPEDLWLLKKIFVNNDLMTTRWPSLQIQVEVVLGIYCEVDTPSLRANLRGK